MWIQKLESMNEILLSEEMENSRIKDHFEEKFNILRDEQKKVKIMITDRRKFIDASDMAE